MPPSGARPGPHPPPPDLAQRAPSLRDVDRPWFRFHGLHRPALYWGLTPTRPYPFRFDAPEGDYGVLYVGADEHSAFIETFGHNTGVHYVALADLRSRYLSRIQFSRPLHLVDLTGPRLARLGADARLFSGDYEVARQWSRAFYQHASTPDGLLYPSRHDSDRLCAALFDRTAPLATSVCLGTLADSAHTPLLLDLLETYAFGLAVV